MDLARGYSHPQLHNLSADASSLAVEAGAEHEQRPLAECTRTAQRCKGDYFVANETKIAAVRISANGWDASILHGLQVNSATRSASPWQSWSRLHLCALFLDVGKKPSSANKRSDSHRLRHPAELAMTHASLTYRCKRDNQYYVECVLIPQRSSYTGSSNDHVHSKQLTVAYL